MTEELGSEDKARKDRERLLAHLDYDSDRAWQKYAELMRRLDKFFEFKRCPEPERMTLETLTRVGARLECEKILDISRYSLGVARNVVREYARTRRLEVSAEDLPGGLDALADSSNQELKIVEQIDQQLLIAFLRESLREMEEPNRSRLLSYYAAPEGLRIIYRRKMAAEVRMNRGALMTLMNRLRSRLRDCVMSHLNPHLGRIDRS